MQGIIKGLLRPGIFQQMLFAMLLVAIVPLAAIWYVDYLDAGNRINRDIGQRLSDASDQLVSHVNDWISMNVKALNQNAALADIVSMNRSKQDPILRSIVDEYPWVLRTFTTARDGKTLGRSDDAKTIDYSDRIYFQEVMRGEPIGRQVIISRVTGKPAIVLAVPIHVADPETGARTILGILAMTCHLTDISNAITNRRIGNTGYAFLLDENGKIVAHQKAEYVKNAVDFSHHPAFLSRSALGKTMVVYDDNGRKVIGVVQKTDLGWYIVTQQDYDEAFAPIQTANRNAAALLAVTLLVVTIFAFVLSRGLTNPIRNLTLIANEMSRGRTVVNIAETRRADELGALAGAIDRMGTSIRLAMERLGAKAASR